MRIYQLPGAIAVTTSFGPPIPYVDFIPLDVTDPDTFTRWCLTGAYDTRTLEEFAADGGYPMPRCDHRQGEP